MQLKPFLVEDRNGFILHGQYHGCWCPGDARRHYICLFLKDYSSLATKSVVFVSTQMFSVYVSVFLRPVAPFTNMV